MLGTVLDGITESIVIGLTIGFNARYLLDFLGAVGEEKFTLHLKDEQTQGMLTPLLTGEIEYRYIVMPMRI